MASSKHNISRSKNGDGHHALGGDRNRADQVHLAPGRAKHYESLVAPMPSKVEFTVTTQCHAGCIMCAYTREGEVLSLEDFKKAADELLPAAEEVLLIGGEVMMHPAFYEMCEYTHHFSVRTKICTNLYTLAGRRAEAVERFLNVVSVSIDGATQPTYESVRSHLSFEGLVHNLHTLAAIKRCNPTLELAWRFVAMKRNIQELPAAVEMAHSFGFDRMHVNFLVVCGGLALDESLLFHRDLANSCFDQARKKADDLGIELKSPPNFDLSGRPFLNADSATDGNIRCPQPWEHVRLAVNGDVTPCCRLQRAPFGNVFRARFDDIWNGRKFQGLREALTTGSAGMPARCRSCRSLSGQQSDSNNLLLHIELKRVPELQEKLESADQM